MFGVLDPSWHLVVPEFFSSICTNQLILIPCYLDQGAFMFLISLIEWWYPAVTAWLTPMCSDIHLLMRPPAGQMAGFPWEGRKLNSRPPALICLYTNKPGMGWQTQTGHYIDFSFFPGWCFYWQLPNTDGCLSCCRRKRGQCGSHEGKLNPVFQVSFCSLYDVLYLNSFHHKTRCP